MNIVNLSATDYQAYILCVTLNYIFDSSFFRELYFISSVFLCLSIVSLMYTYIHIYFFRSLE